MTLKEYAERIRDLAKKYPSAIVVHQIGNDLCLTLSRLPQAGHYYTTLRFDEQVKPVNAVMVN